MGGASSTLHCLTPQVLPQPKVAAPLSFYLYKVEDNTQATDSFFSLSPHSHAPNSAGFHTSGSLTHNQTNLTVLIIITTGHHGPNCVIHHGHNVNVKVLQRIKGTSSSKWGHRHEDGESKMHHASVLLTQAIAKDG